MPPKVKLTHAVPLEPDRDPFEVDRKIADWRAKPKPVERNTPLEYINANRFVAITVFIVLIMFVCVFPLAVVSAMRQSQSFPTPTARPIVPTPTTYLQAQTDITAASINAQMKPGSETVVLSIQPLSLPVQQAKIDQQIVITQGLVGASFFGWYDNRSEGDLSFSCSDQQCGHYDPTRVYYVCGGWVGINSNQLQSVLSVIKSDHLCVEAQRIPAADRSVASIGLISQSVRRLLIGDTVLWPILYVEVYADKAPYPVASLGK